MDIKNYYKKITTQWKRWAYIIGGMACLAFGFVLATLWVGQRENTLLTFGVIALWPLGAFLIYRGWRKMEAEVVIVGGEKPSTPVNSLNIYAKKDKETGLIYPEKIAFEMMVNPMGQPWQCINNSKWYHIHIWDIEKNRLKPVILPDSQYFDPREFANVIKMPAHKKLFERQMSTFQKVAPWIMVVAFLISIIGLVATTPGG